MWRDGRRIWVMCVRVGGGGRKTMWLAAHEKQMSSFVCCFLFEKKIHYGWYIPQNVAWKSLTVKWVEGRRQRHLLYVDVRSTLSVLEIPVYFNLGLIFALLAIIPNCYNNIVLIKVVVQTWGHGNITTTKSIDAWNEHRTIKEVLTSQ